MNTDTTQAQIRELEALRNQKRFWSIGVTVGVAIIVIFCLLRLRNAITGLTSEGPVRAQFASDFSSRMQKNVMPSVEQLATQAVREVNYGAEVQKLNQRTPALAQATLAQVKQLGENISKRGEKVLDDTFQAQMKAQEAKIRADFPEATNEQVTKLMNALLAEAKTRVTEVNSELFAPHQQALNNIIKDMRTIQTTEGDVAQNEVPTWQMGLMIFDIARADMKDLAPAATDQTATPGAKGTKQ